MNPAHHWKKALPYYLRVSIRFSAIFWAPPLAVVLIGAVWLGLTNHHLAISRVGLGLAITFGAFFFLLAFLTAVGDDIHRNWRTQEPTVEWNARLVWKTFLYVGALFFIVASFFAYRQSVWTSVTFAFLSVGSAITARICF
jgi:hypothetical protein